jgi:predicted transcriptional regulator
MKEEKDVKISTKKENFYLPIINFLKTSTNLTKLQEKLNIPRQNLNYYLRELKKRGIIEQKGKGWYELIKGCKNSTKYGKLLVKDSIRGHAYVLEVKLQKEIKDWDKRIEILKNKKVNYKLVGAKLDIPRIKVLGRKVWLCKDHLRIFDKKDMSYYGNNAKESRNKAISELKLIVGILEKKLGVLIKPSDIYIRKEHYALIKNDLAIEENKKGNIWRISDEYGEWLLIDDSLEQGGELENVGKSSYKINIPMQKWWNDNKRTNFEVTPTFLMESLNKVIQVQKVEVENKKEYSRDLVEHKEAIKRMSYNTEANTKSIELLADIISQLKDELINIKNGK